VWASNSSTHAERVLAVAEEAAAEQGLACSSAMMEGDPADVIVNLAARHEADLLVVGNVGMNRRLLGSVPNTVTHKAPCSVLVVKTV
jgi:nucleotide-binding universal stress UspA family protein